MTEPTLNYVSCPSLVPSQSAEAQHKMAWWSWGPTTAEHVIVCVHGLTRQGRDFDVLAQALLTARGVGVRIVCPDVVGRGHSDWLSNPMGYQIPQYGSDMVCLLNALHAQAPITTLDWVGTSMGGLIGLGLAGQRPSLLPVSMRRLVLNDVGPVIQWQALQRIGAYLGSMGAFDSIEQAAAAMWAVSQGFGPHSPAQWLDLSRPMVRARPEGGWTLHYDPSIATPFRALTQEAAQAGETALWALYDQIEAQTLLIRGAESDLLSREVAECMTSRGPHAQLLEFSGVGHAPTLIHPEQYQAVVDFLLN